MPPWLFVIALGSLKVCLSGAVAEQMPSGVIRRRGHVNREDSLAPTKRPRSMVINRGNSPSRSAETSPTSTPVMKPRQVVSPRHRGQIQLSDGSDSDAVGNSPHVESECVCVVCVCVCVCGHSKRGQ